MAFGLVAVLPIVRWCSDEATQAEAVSGTRILGIRTAYKKDRADHLARHGFGMVAQDADLRSWDLAAVLTDHDATAHARIADTVPGVFDTRDVYRRRGLQPANVVTL